MMKAGPTRDAQPRMVTEADLRVAAAFLRRCARHVRAEGENPSTRRANWTTAGDLERIAALREVEADALMTAAVAKVGTDAGLSRARQRHS